MTLSTMLHFLTSMLTHIYSLLENWPIRPFAEIFPHGLFPYIIISLFNLYFIIKRCPGQGRCTPLYIFNARFFSPQMDESSKFAFSLLQEAWYGQKKFTTCLGGVV
jgi:hypothetical protein